MKRVRVATLLSALERLQSTLKARKGGTIKVRRILKTVNWIIGQARQL